MTLSLSEGLPWFLPAALGVLCSSDDQPSAVPSQRCAAFCPSAHRLEDVGLLPAATTRTKAAVNIRERLRGDPGFPSGGLLQEQLRSRRTLDRRESSGNSMKRRSSSRVTSPFSLSTSSPRGLLLLPVRRRTRCLSFPLYCGRQTLSPCGLTCTSPTNDDLSVSSCASWPFVCFFADMSQIS